MRHETVARLYRLQGRLNGAMSRVSSHVQMNERLREMTDSRGAAQAYSFNMDLSRGLLDAIGSIQSEVECILEEEGYGRE